MDNQQEEKGMQFGAARPSKHQERRLAALWRMWQTQQATRKHRSALATERRTAHLNLDNKPLGDK